MAVITSVPDNLIYYPPNMNSAFVEPMYVKTDIVPIIVLSLVTLLANGILRAMTSTNSFALGSLCKNLYLFFKENFRDIIKIFKKLVEELAIATGILLVISFLIAYYDLLDYIELIGVHYKDYILFGLIVLICLCFVIALYGFIKMTTYFTKDMSLLSSMFIDDSKRPKNSIEAINTLNVFKTDYFKHQYICNLINWIPYEKNIQPIVEEAVKYNIEIRDELYKLADVWTKKGY